MAGSGWCSLTTDLPAPAGIPVSDGLVRPLDLEDPRLAGGDGDEAVEDLGRARFARRLGEADVSRRPAVEHEGRRAEDAMVGDGAGVVARERRHRGRIAEIATKRLHVEAGGGRDPLDHRAVVEVEPVAMPRVEQRVVQLFEAALPPRRLGGLKRKPAADLL